MNTTSFTDWLKTTDGLLKTIMALLSTLALLYVGSEDYIKILRSHFDINFPPQLDLILPSILVMCIALLTIKNYRSFSKASRIELPDRFDLMPSSPQTLVGREEDIQILCRLVKTKAVTLLIGESGSGKSALIKAGLIPTLNESRLDNGIISILISDWGEDWSRGPTISVLEALFNELAPSQRDQITWTCPPNLLQDTPELLLDLSKRITDISLILHLSILIVADQFDDYQSSHRDCFLDADGTWLTSSELISRNPFWKIMGAAVNRQQIRLLIVTRLDTADGLCCMPIVPEELKSTRTLKRVDKLYLRKLLSDIAPDGSNPVVISNPEFGWHDLRDRIQQELNQENLLMQQVKTTLYGLKCLNALTIKNFRLAGGLGGLEVLVIRKALTNAADRINVSGDITKEAREILQLLIFKGDGFEAPKAKRELLNRLSEVNSNEDRTLKILRSLQADNIVRCADLGKVESAWQLDHDYLANAVLSEYIASNNLNAFLRDRALKFEKSSGNIRHQWAALLSLGAFIRLLIAASFGRVSLSSQIHFVRLSAIKNIVITLIFITGIYCVWTWYGASQYRDQAEILVSKMTSKMGEEAVIDIWLSEKNVRDQFTKLVAEDKSGLTFKSDFMNNWHLAIMGYSQADLKVVAEIFRNKVESQNIGDDPQAFYSAYNDLIVNLTDQEYLLQTAHTIRTYILDDKHSTEGAPAVSYIVAVRKIKDKTTLLSEIKVFREILLNNSVKNIGDISIAYACLVELVADRQEYRPAIKILLPYLKKDPEISEHLFLSISHLSSLIEEGNEVQDLLPPIREMLFANLSYISNRNMGSAYASLIGHISDQNILASEIESFHGAFENGNLWHSHEFKSAYVTATTKILDTQLRSKVNDFIGAKAASLNELDAKKFYTLYYKVLTEHDQIVRALKLLASAIRQDTDDYYTRETYKNLVPKLAGTPELLKQCNEIRGEATYNKENQRRLEAYFFCLNSINDQSILLAETKVIANNMRSNDRSESTLAAISYQIVGSKITQKSELFSGFRYFISERHKDRFEKKHISVEYLDNLIDKSESEAEISMVEAFISKIIYFESPVDDRRILDSYSKILKKSTNPELLKKFAKYLEGQFSSDSERGNTDSAIHNYSLIADYSPNKDQMLISITSILERCTSERTSSEKVQNVYLSLIDRFYKENDLLKDRALLKYRMENPRNKGDLLRAAPIYALVSSRLNDPSTLLESSKVIENIIFLDKLFFREQCPFYNENCKTGLFSAYMLILGKLIQVSDETIRPEIIKKILSMSRHPFYGDPAAALDALKTLRAKKFEDISDAVQFSKDQYGVNPELLWPGYVFK